ncbi:hypothetical protein SAMN04488500_101174 [Sporomusa malonica]|uniref:Uncharacterized protein n=1 Tax=Sporomusa malonica TaxID=112901 RepID=A0A1W1YBB7_9FIRM|nr:hypothetical protein SAMN04488500_101174 [Sporomusa malonica]
MEEILYVLYYDGKPLKVPHCRIRCAYDSEIRARQVINGVLKQRGEIDISKITIVKYGRAEDGRNPNH